MTLLPKKSKGITTLPEECQFMFYGPPGIGKSKAASTFPKVCFLSTTRGLGHLDVPEARVESWEEFLEVCREISKGGHGYRCFAVDLLRDLYDYCIDFVSDDQLGGKHPSEFDWGKGWGAVGKEFRSALSLLMEQKDSKGVHYGFIYIAHQDTKEVKTRAFKIDKYQPRLTDSTFNWLFSIIDFMIFMQMEQYRDKDEREIQEHRVMHMAPSVMYEAKRWSETEMPDKIVFENENVYELIFSYMRPNSSRRATPSRKKTSRRSK